MQSSHIEKLLFLCALILPTMDTAISIASTSGTASLERRQQYLRDSFAINIASDHRHSISLPPTLQDKDWRSWQTRTGELPPDFSAMPSYPFLPDPLLFQNNDGTTSPVTTPAEWQQQRVSIKQRFQKWVSGTVPPAPSHVTAEILSSITESDGTRVQMIQVRFGQQDKATMTFELLIPPGPGPFPVYMTQWNHRNWAQLAVRRGYMGCVYAGADSKDDTQAYQALYPDFDFTCLMRRAWGASRVIDYLYTCSDVNKDHIAITGHSRNGKQSLWAGAFDDRITAVISSSSGTGGTTPWRYSDPQYCNQTLDDICSNAAHWFHPRLRFFFGREDKLPVDQNELIALIAPRALLFHYSMVEKQINPWVNEQVFNSVGSVYKLLGHEERIGIFPRMGEHAVAARDVERCIDFLDIQFGYRKLPWENELHYTYNFKQWANAHPELTSAAAALSRIDLQSGADKTLDVPTSAILQRLQWLLGEAPAGASPRATGPSRSASVDWIHEITGLPALSGASLTNIGSGNGMGDYLRGSLYMPVDDNGKTRTRPNGKIPVVIYLHQYSYAHGFVNGYYSTGGSGTTRLLRHFIDAGYAVLAIDMFGFGTRIEDADRFYQRHPGWSKMGKMVADVKTCVDAVLNIDPLDPDRVFVFGNTIGGSVGLLAAARDNRISGIAVVASVSPWRSSNSQYESIRTFSHLHGFMPRLGFYADKPKQTPVDYAEIMSVIAPRPLLVIAPTLDRYSDPAAVNTTMETVKSVYELHEVSDNLHVETPREINRLTDEMNKSIIDFFNQH